MMLSEEHHPTMHVPHVPPWPSFDDVIFFPLSVNGDVNAVNAGDYSPYYLDEALSAMQRYLPSIDDGDGDYEFDIPARELESPVDAFSCDHFRMFDFKIRRCGRGRSHDWTECPYAHPGEKARRRDPRKFHYSGTACPDFRKGGCQKGDACEFSHGVFECWLHPARYRTQPCKDGVSCRRRVCFFAHTAEQLRVLPQHSPRSADSYDGSPLRLKTLQFIPSPELNSPIESPPVSPLTQSMVFSLRNMQLEKMKSLPSSWNIPIGSPRFGSPVGPVTRLGFSSLPSTPTTPGRAGVNCFELWDQNCCVEEPVMERVESGRNIRAKMFEKLSKENSLGKPGSGQGKTGGAPDVSWVSEQ
ncbi:hypothetical protein Lal_00026799 [Lupinus albus]|uniref:Putative transcription factor C3H family n=1 Tax=Lupinus albus TaxID=3870 RepID=A0A6A4Q1L3_LUPAL|nr:putative transcription factor C3H family [Lupinus albus]KAF1862273.1 hypothetical protein Lal_00026799 [Lupinus albus]